MALARNMIGRSLGDRLVLAAVVFLAAVWIAPVGWFNADESPCPSPPSQP